MPTGGVTKRQSTVGNQYPGDFHIQRQFANDRVPYICEETEAIDEAINYSIK